MSLRTPKISSCTACPPDAAPLACIDGLAAHVEEVRRRNEAGAFVRVVRVLAAEAPLLEIRRWITDILMGISTPAFDRYVEKHALRTVRLTALRVHAAVLRHHARTGACPEDLAGAAWDALTVDRIFGGRVRADRGPAGGEWTIRPAGAFGAESVNADAVYEFRCPPGG